MGWSFSHMFVWREQKVCWQPPHDTWPTEGGPAPCLVTFPAIERVPTHRWQCATPGQGYPAVAITQQPTIIMITQWPSQNAYRIGGTTSKGIPEQRQCVPETEPRDIRDGIADKVSDSWWASHMLPLLDLTRTPAPTWAVVIYTTTKFTDFIYLFTSYNHSLICLNIPFFKVQFAMNTNLMWNSFDWVLSVQVAWQLCNSTSNCCIASDNSPLSFTIKQALG